jgi:hypothetical protein
MAFLDRVLWDNAILQYVVLTALALFASLDLHGVRITSLLWWSWLALSGMLIASPALIHNLSIVYNNRHPDGLVASFYGAAATAVAAAPSSKRGKSTSDRDSLLGSGGGGGGGGGGVQLPPGSPSYDEMRGILCCAFYYASFAFYLALSCHLNYIYAYTKMTPAYQTMVDRGYPAANNPPLAMINKMEALGSLVRLWPAVTAGGLLWLAVGFFSVEKKGK